MANNTSFTQSKPGWLPIQVAHFYDLPIWQEHTGASIQSVNNNETGRVIPDVSGLAAGGDWQIFQNSHDQYVGGTSAVAPMWAAFIALINEGRAAEGKAALGWINERLYHLAASDQASYFNDITSGNNDSPATLGYSARPGFDAVTGWGTPKGSSLTDALLKWD